MLDLALKKRISSLKMTEKKLIVLWTTKFWAVIPFFSEILFPVVIIADTFSNLWMNKTDKQTDFT